MKVTTFSFLCLYFTTAFIFIFSLETEASKIVFSSFLGGLEHESAVSIGIDSSGNIYVGGNTASADFPTTSGSYDTDYNSEDSIISKISSDGRFLMYSSFLGGSAKDTLRSFKVNPAGDCYITGTTESADFPTTSGVIDTTFNSGVSDIFICSINPDGSILNFSTFLGGSLADGDVSGSIDLDISGNIYITGNTFSDDFPVTAAAYDPSINGESDVFISKMNSTGTSLIYSTFLGGLNNDNGYGIRVDGLGTVYVTGDTKSLDFPTTISAFDTDYNGGDRDAFITKLDTSGSNLVFSSYIGGNFHDYGADVVLDTAGDAFVIGYTGSPDFPVSLTAFDRLLNSGTAIYILKIQNNGSDIIYSTFLEGSLFQVARSADIDLSGNIYLTGMTSSPDFPFTADGYDTTYNGGTDVVLCKISPDGSELLYSSFLGGVNSEAGLSIVLDSSSGLYVTGGTSSPDFPVTFGVFDTTYNGGLSDIFVTKLSLTNLTLPVTGTGEAMLICSLLTCGIYFRLLKIFRL